MKRLLSILLFFSVFGLNSHLYAKNNAINSINSIINIKSNRSNTLSKHLKESKKIFEDLNNFLNNSSLSKEEKNQYLNKNAIDIVSAAEFYLTQYPDLYIQRLLETMRQYMLSSTYKAYLDLSRK